MKTWNPLLWCKKIIEILVLAQGPYLRKMGLGLLYNLISESRLQRARLHPGLLSIYFVLITNLMRTH